MYEGEDRTKQISELRKLADTVAHYGGSSAEDIVEFALNTEVQMPLPSWFDSHDRTILVRFVEDIVS